jgi:hypothetical protein
LAIVAGSGIYAHAQSSTTGAISGVVRDAKGSPIAGATVTASSTQLTRTAISAADGSFRLALLTPGEWSIKASKGTLTAATKKASVLVNNSSTINFDMKPEASAVVTVVATTAVMDPTTSQVGSVLQMDTLSAIPKGRDFNGLVLLAPGTQSGGAMGGNSISGASAIENSFLVDGLDTTDYRKGFQGAVMPTDFFDQVEVMTGGFRPEFSALGGVVNAITKSGTNEFQGSAWITSDMAQLQGRVEHNDFYRSTVPNYRYDLGFTAGGAIVADKFFYFLGVNQINTESIPDTNKSGYKDTVQTDKSTNIYAKFNLYLTQGQQLTATFNSVNEPIDYANRYPVAYGNRNTGYSQSNKTTNWSLNYDWTITPSLLLNAKYGSTAVEQHVTPTTIAPSITDYVWYAGGPGMHDGITPGTAFVHGGMGDWSDTDKGDNKQFRLDLSWFLGDHSLKFGFSHANATSFVNDLLAADDRVQINRSGNALSSIYITTYANLGSHAEISWNGYYAQDQWEVKPGFRIAYGFRLETQTVTGNDGKTFVKFNDIKDQLQPRLGITWDVNNDGKTKLSANYAVYQERFPMQAALRTAGNETYVQRRFRASTGNATYNYTTGAYAYSGSPYAVYDYSGYFRDYPQDQIDGLKVPKRSEYILGMDHTLASGWTVGAHAKYRKTIRIVEDTVPTDADGNPIDGEGFSILWNPHAGQTYRWANNKYHSDPGGLNTWTNTVFPEPKNNYSSVDLTLDRKTDKYVLSINYTLSHSYGNYEGVGQSSNGQADANITSTWDYYPYVGSGDLALDRRHMVKAYGSYTFDLFGGLLAIGGKLTYQSGTPKSYFDNTNDVGGYGNATPENGMYGTRGRLPGQTVGDMHLEYQYKFSPKVKLVPSIDIFNVFNSRTQTGWDQYGTTSGSVTNPAFGYQTGWLQGRNYRWGVKLSF